MSDMIEYKCPACGGAMEFDSKSQKMKCPYCDTEMEVSEFQEIETDLGQKESGEEAGEEAVFQNAGSAVWEENETTGMKVYVCESCGGEVVADETTGASTCPFCGNRIVIKGQFAGDLKPDLIIPFQLDKKAAKQAYLNHLKGKKFLPTVFKQENHIDEMKGIYVPFWIFDADVEADISYKGERINIWTSGDTEYTETEFYQMERRGRISFESIPTDASEKMDDELMESIEPYRVSEAVPFQPAFLAGYMADRYDVRMEERLTRASERIKASTREACEHTVTGFQNVRETRSRIDIKNAKYRYAMYPVWILNTTWREKKYIFAMNGQTGKLVGDLPADNKAFWRYVAARSVIFGAIIYALMWVMALL